MFDGTAARANKVAVDAGVALVDGVAVSHAARMGTARSATNTSGSFIQMGDHSKLRAKLSLVRIHWYTGMRLVEVLVPKAGQDRAACP